MVTASGCIAMYLALEAILDDGDEVIVPTPYFTIYKTQIELARGKIVELDTFEEEHWQIDPDRLESCITPKTKVIIINSPNNPTGSCLSPDTMNKIAKVAQKHDLVVISDEIYTIYSFAQKFIPFSSLEGMKERTITINSFSKNFVMTGWRLGMVIAPPHIVNTIKNINENLIYVGTFHLTAGGTQGAPMQRGSAAAAYRDLQGKGLLRRGKNQPNPEHACNLSADGELLSFY